MKKSIYLLVVATATWIYWINPNLNFLKINVCLFWMFPQCFHSDACRHSKVRLENNETDSIQRNMPGNIPEPEYLFQQ